MLSEIGRSLAGGTTPERYAAAPTAWWHHAIADDVVVLTRSDASPWRTRQIREAIDETGAQFAASRQRKRDVVVSLSMWGQVGNLRADCQSAQKEQEMSSTAANFGPIAASGKEAPSPGYAAAVVDRARSPGGAHLTIQHVFRSEEEKPLEVNLLVSVASRRGPQSLPDHRRRIRSAFRVN